MELRSVDIKPNGSIPVLHTCDGASISPHLEWDGVPEGTKSFAISCLDPDAAAGVFAHWLVTDIPPDTIEIAQGGRPGGIQLNNDFGGRGYGGPCPPTGTHHYTFTLYALDVEKLDGVTRENFQELVDAHTIERAELACKYRRK